MCSCFRTRENVQSLINVRKEDLPGVWGTREHGHLLLGTREQKVSKTGNAGTKVYFRELTRDHGTPQPSENVQPLSSAKKNSSGNKRGKMYIPLFARENVHLVPNARKHSVVPST